MGCWATSPHESEKEIEFLCTIPKSFTDSTLVFYGLNKYVKFYDEAYKIITGRQVDLNKRSSLEQIEIHKSVYLLYGLLHQRFIISETGLNQMLVKYKSGIYGKCPRTACRGETLLPYGMDNEPGKNSLKGFCPRCHDIYETEIDIDGAFFGPDFPFMFMRYHEINFPKAHMVNYVKSGNPKIDKRLHRK